MNQRIALKVWFVFFCFLFFQVAYATSGTPNPACQSIPQQGLRAVCTTVAGVCNSIRQLIPAVAMLMIIGSAVVYILGQWTGAETRARANVWSNNMLVGAVIGLIIATVGPVIINSLWVNAVGGQAVTC